VALYAEIRKIDEDAQRVRYRYTDSAGVEQDLLLDKTTEVLAPGSGQSEDMLYRAVARKVAVAWVREGIAPERLVVRS
jgi:hypothetical protein